ncbi:MAG: hypothetical protein HUU16_14145 [Candidatus Omnitrophica bacterium]|nr:hypothetical protein [Candidatus Omnitrophota bacterium]
MSTVSFMHVRRITDTLKRATERFPGTRDVREIDEFIKIERDQMPRA